MVLADGVSTCEQAKEGAALACESVIEFLLQHSNRLFFMENQAIANSLISQVTYRLGTAAQQQNHGIEEYSSTLACVLFDRRSNKMLYFSVGDSLITAVKDSMCYIVAMPADSRNGCCVTTTLNAAADAKVGIIDVKGVSSVMICSDGAWRLMYRRTRMNPELEKLIVSQEYDKLREQLLEKDRFDDCSFILMDLKSYARRKIA